MSKRTVARVLLATLGLLALRHVRHRRVRVGALVHLGRRYCVAIVDDNGQRTLD